MNIDEQFRLQTENHEDPKVRSFALITRCVAHGLTAGGSPGSLLEFQNLRPHPGPIETECAS